MKLFWSGKDGGPESNVTGYFLIEWKPVISIALMKFSDGTRKALHSHAFHSISWLLKGELMEICPITETDGRVTWHRPGLFPILTLRSTFHKVRSIGTSWVLTVRGPWLDTWNEYRESENRFVTLTHGRREVA